MDENDKLRAGVLPHDPLAGLRLLEVPKSRNGQAATERDEAAHEGPIERLTDLGNALRLVRLVGAELRYVGPWRRWLLWDARRWRPDPDCEVLRRFDGVLHALIQEAAEIEKKAATFATEGEATRE